MDKFKEIKENKTNKNIVFWLNIQIETYFYFVAKKCLRKSCYLKDERLFKRKLNLLFKSKRIPLAVTTLIPHSDRPSLFLFC
jgi:hypothetical protein